MNYIICKCIAMFCQDDNIRTEKIKSMKVVKDYGHSVNRYRAGRIRCKSVLYLIPWGNSGTDMLEDVNALEALGPIVKNS